MTKKQTIIGIDPGVNGALAAISNGRLVEIRPAPTISVQMKKRKRTVCDEREMRHMLTRFDSPIVFIEEVHVRPMVRRDKEGKRTPLPVGPGQLIRAGHLMGGYMLWRGILVGLDLPYNTVLPQVWQKAMLAGMPKYDTKASSIIVAQRLWPDVSFKRTARCTKAHDGMTDAALIATYGWRRLTGA